jgi:hypothetical protein
MNEINVIEPYRYLEMWVFDDPKVGLSAEPFVGGADTMIDRVTAELPNADRGSSWSFREIPFLAISFISNGEEKRAPGTFTIHANSMPKAGSVQLSFATLKRGRPRFMFR